MAMMNSNNEESAGEPAEPEKDAPPEGEEAEETLAEETAVEEADAEIADGEDGDEEAGGEAPDGESPLSLPSVVEAVLFAARDPLKLPQIARAVGKRTRQEAVRAAIDDLNVHYLETGRAFEIAEVSGRWQLMSRPEFAPHIMKIYPKGELSGDREKAQRLTPAALDTLAIIAYKQPVTRAEIEHIRGVGCGPVLKALMERDSIRVAGKRMDMLGQPLAYGTTERFLAEFGLGSLDELPMRNDFLAILGVDIPPVEAVEEEVEEVPAGEAVAEFSAAPGDGIADGAGGGGDAGADVVEVEEEEAGGQPSDL